MLFLCFQNTIAHSLKNMYFSASVSQCYISEAVNRLFRPQPAEPVSSDPNSPGESGVDGEPPDCGISQDDIVNSSEREGIDDEQQHATVSLLSTSSSTVAGTACANDSKSDEGEATQLRKGNECKESQDERRTREEGLDHDELLDAEEEKANQAEQEDTEIKIFYSYEQSGLFKNEEESTNVVSVGLTNETVSKVMEKSDKEGGGGDEESKTQDDCQKVEEATTETQITEDDAEENLDDEEKLCMIEEGVDTDDVAPIFKMKDANICEGALQLSSETENISEERGKQADSQFSVCAEVSENELIVPDQEIGGKKDEKMSVTASQEEDSSDTAQKLDQDEEPETEKNNRTVQDGQREDNVLNESVPFSEAAEFTCKEEDVVVTVETTGADVTTAETDLNQRFLGKDQVRKESPTSEVDNNANCLENVCTLVTVKPETAQEASREFKNISQRMSEGQATESQERSTEASEETREGVPEHNNELESGENKTQGFLEGGNCGEIHNIPLPEKVEDEELASLINSGTGADYLLEGELLEERQDSADLNNITFDLSEEELTESQPSAQDTEKPLSGKGNLESEFFFEEEEVELLDSSMKTKFKPLGEELETYDETDMTMEELQDRVKAPGFGTDGEPVNAKEAAEDGDERNKGAAVDKEVEFDQGTPISLETQAITEPSLCLDSAQSTHTYQTGEGTYNLEDTADLMISQQMEIKLFEDNIKILHVDTEEEDSTAEEEEDNKMQDTNQTTLQLAETTEALIQTQNDNANALITESVVSTHSETHTMTNQSPLRALQVQEINIMTDTKVANEAKIAEARNNLEMPAEETKQERRYTEEMSSLVTSHQYVTDEELLDLWMETAMSKDSDNEEEDRFELQEHTAEQQLKEESGKHSPESEKQLLMEPYSIEPTAVSDSESLLEPGYLEQTQRLKPTTSVEDVHNKLVTTSQSADSSEVSALDSESQAENAEPGRVTESCSDSGLSSSEEKLINGGSQRSLEELDENPPETEADMETGTTAWKETEEAGVTLLINVHFQAETRAEDEPVKDVFFEEGFILTEPPSGGEQLIESEENQTSVDHRSSEELTESLLKLSRAEVAEKQTVILEDQDEVLFPVRS